MEFSNDGYFYIVVLFSRLLHQCASQEQNDCFQVTKRNDFKQFENSCYWVSSKDDKRYWKNAQIVCNDFGGNLATISNKATLEFLKSHWDFANVYYWIGLYLNESVTSDDLGTRRRANWKWLDGTKYDWTKYVSQTDFGWTQSEPDKGESFVCLYNVQILRASQNTTKYSFICQTNLSDAASSNSTSSTTSTASTSSTTSTPSITFTPSTTSTTSTTSPPSTTPTSSTTSSKQNMSGGMPTQIPVHVRPGPNLQCGGNWTYLETAKLCYILNKSEMTFAWTSAEEKCKHFGGHLASLSTQERHDAVVALIREKNIFDTNVWIGLMHEGGADGSNPRFGWQWLDGSPYTFEKWADYEPQQGEKYARLKDGNWSGINTGKYNNYLCQKEPIEIMSPDVPGSTPIQNDSPTTMKTGLSGGGSDNSRILGPVLGVLGGAIIIALVGLVIFMKRQRETQFNALMHRLRIDQWFKKSTKPEEPYSDIKDEDLDKHHVYYNETGDRGPQSRNSSLGNETTISPASVQQVPSDVPIDDLYELSLKPEHEYTPLQRIHRRTE